MLSLLPLASTWIIHGLGVRFIHTRYPFVRPQLKEDRDSHGDRRRNAVCAAAQQLDRTAGKEMLVLSRKVGERILIGENISVTVVRITGGAVRIGVEAPPELTVIRHELQEPSHVVEAPQQRR
jgi:carbon storage regulator